jgi:prepilin-type N-terminal cleavage/methylation domain-containing protein
MERRDSGFTLIELIVVVAIMGVMLAFAVPNLMHWRPNAQLRGAADDILMSMQRAKMHAIKNNVSVIFAFAPAATCPGGSYTFTDSAGNIVSQATLADNTCLAASTFLAGEGFSSRGFPIGSLGGMVVVTHQDLGDSGNPTYTISQTVAGAIQMIRVPVP